MSTPKASQFAKRHQMNYERTDISCLIRAPERHCRRERGSAYGGIWSKCKMFFKLSI